MIACQTIIYAQHTDHNVSIVVPEVALLSIQNSTNQHTLDIVPIINEAGEDISFTTSKSEIWINYTSIIGSKTEPSRSVFMQITEGSMPSGLDLIMAISNDAGLGNGKMGIPVKSAAISSNQPTQIIDNIGSGYTGAGFNKGHQVVYAVQKNSQYNNFWLADKSTTTTLQITYTLSDN
ncbi:MAG: hypothetical protein KGZ87_02630 [Bacteroidetes bacterium]|nr:hypothetical protein [Bacteroidota bacterium]